MTLQLREIQAAKRAPLNPAKWDPISTNEWPDGGMLLFPRVPHSAAGGIVWAPITAHLGSCIKVRDDTGPDGRVYRLCVTTDAVTGVAPLRAWPAWARTGAPRVAIVNTPSNNARFLQITLPSVTTILDAVSGEQVDLEAWRASVGYDVADKITEESAIKGTNVHEMCEKYARYGEVRESVTTSVTGASHTQYTNEEWMLFHLMRRHLEQFSAMVGAEVTVFNTKMGYSGTIDLLARRGGRLVLIDIKTYRRYRKPEHLLKAKIQVTLYAKALKDGYGIEVDEAEIVYANPDTGLVIEPVDLNEYDQTADDYIGKYYVINP